MSSSWKRENEAAAQATGVQMTAVTAAASDATQKKTLLPTLRCTTTPQTCLAPVFPLGQDAHKNVDGLAGLLTCKRKPGAARGKIPGSTHKNTAALALRTTRSKISRLHRKLEMLSQNLHSLVRLPQAFGIARPSGPQQLGQLLVRPLHF